MRRAVMGVVVGDAGEGVTVYTDKEILTYRRKGRGMRYLRALPYVMILTTAWTAGEVWGYITRRP